MSDDLYETLGLNKDANEDQIKKAFKKMAMQYHPDKNPDNPDASEKFKKVNEAYSTLSDPDQRAVYDRFGKVGGAPGSPGFPGGGMDLNDIIKNMFGEIPGMAGVPGGFSFVFSTDGTPGTGAQRQQSQGIPDDIFGMFGGMPGMPQRGGPGRRPLNPDILEVPIDINDLFYGNSKKVEFEQLEKCTPCDGSGAYDAAHIIKCITCRGEGHVQQQMNPFFAQTVTCPSCAGKGTTIKNNKFCPKCNGSKTCYSKKIFELKLPKGVPNDHEVRMEKKGSYDEKTRQNKDILFRFKYNIQEPYKLDHNLNVIYTLKITIEDLLAGFVKKIKVYNEDMTIKSDRYFNPHKTIILKNQGILNMKKNKTTDLIIMIHVDFIDSERLSKYNDIFQKVLKREDLAQELTGTIIDITSLLSQS